jgi:four helix bundle protein
MYDLLERTKNLAVDIIKLCTLLPTTLEFLIISKQLIRCATSVGANYRSARRGKSTQDFLSKLSIVEEEADEALYWMELLQKLGCSSVSELAKVYNEMNEITAIIVACKKTTRRNQQR